MNEFRNNADVAHALIELGGQLALRDADPVTALCCSASALCVIDALSRRTLEVDAVAMIGAAGEIVRAEEFSPEMDNAISAAGLTLQLDRD